MTNVTVARRRLPRLGCWVVFLAVMTLFPAIARAQSVTSSAIQGQVRDETGAALPGVTVTLTSPSLQVPSLTATTEADGTYRFRDLPAGVYRMTYELSGFLGVVREGFQLRIGFIAKVDTVLKVGRMQESVTVSGQAPVVDTTTTGVAVNFSQQVLETVPRGRALWDVLAMAPGITVFGAPDVGDSNMSHRSNISNYGGSGQPKLTIDGINVTHNTDASAAHYIDYGSFDEVQVKAAGNDAEMPGAGVRFLATIKSGGNEFHGSFAGSYQGPRLQSNNIDAKLTAQGIQNSAPLRHYYDVSGELGGRIVRDKLWFYGNILRQDMVTQLLGFAKSPGADKVYLTPDDVPGDTTTRLGDQTLKVSYQPAKKYRLAGVYQRNGKYLPDGAQDGTLLVPFEATTNYVLISQVAKGELQGTPTNKALFNIVGGYYGYVADYKAQSDIAGDPSRRNLQTGLRLGPAFTTWRPVWRYQSEGSFTYFADQFPGGKHDLKAGYTYNSEGTGTSYLAKASGTYLLTFSTVSGVPDQPYQITTYNDPVDPTNLMTGAGLYVKDTWTIGSRLTLNLGLRWDRYHSFVHEQSKRQGVFGTSGTYPAVDVLTWRRMVPRVGFAWDLKGNGKTVVKATYGAFNRAMNSGFGGSYNKAVRVTTVYRWNDRDGNRDYTPGEVNLDTNGPDFVSVSSAANNLLNPDLKQPSQREVTLGLERELVPNVAVRGLYVYQRSSDSYASMNVLRPFSAYSIPVPRRDPGPDGLLNTADDGPMVTLYDYTPAYRGSAFVANKNLNGTDSDYYHSVEASITKRTSGRWGFMGSFGATKNHRWLTQPSLAASPNVLFYPLNDTWDWNSKLSGSYRFPRDIQFSALWQAQIGLPGQRTYTFLTNDPSGPPLTQLGTVSVRLEPYGSRRDPALNNVNLRVLKRFILSPSRRLEIDVNLYNLFNANTATATADGGTIWASGPTFGYVTQILPPRIVRIGARFIF